MLAYKLLQFGGRAKLPSVILRNSSTIIRQFSDLKLLPISTIKVNPNVKILVDAKEGAVTIRPYDVIENPDGNLLRTSLASASSEELVIKYFEDLNMVEIKSRADTHFFLEVPVKADLEVKSDSSVDVSNMLNEFTTIYAAKDVRTKNLSSTSITVKSSGGHIKMMGTTLGHSVVVSTERGGKIHLDKVLGEKLVVTTERGEIQTKSCYSSESHFKTQTGDLHLKSVHKNCKVDIGAFGNLNMTGFNGTLNANVEGPGPVTLQLSEIHAQSKVTCSSPNCETTVNLADAILADCHVQVVSGSGIEFKESLKFMKPNVVTPHVMNQIEHGDPANEKKLKIDTKGKLSLGKMSWEDTFEWDVLNKMKF